MHLILTIQNLYIFLSWISHHYVKKSVVNVLLEIFMALILSVVAESACFSVYARLGCVSCEKRRFSIFQFSMFSRIWMYVCMHVCMRVCDVCFHQGFINFPAKWVRQPLHLQWIYAANNLHLPPAAQIVRLLFAGSTLSCHSNKIRTTSTQGGRIKHC